MGTRQDTYVEAFQTWAPGNCVDERTSRSVRSGVLPQKFEAITEAIPLNSAYFAKEIGLETIGEADVANLDDVAGVPDEAPSGPPGYPPQESKGKGYGKHTQDDRYTEAYGKGWHKRSGKGSYGFDGTQ